MHLFKKHIRRNQSYSVSKKSLFAKKFIFWIDLVDNTLLAFSILLLGFFIIDLFNNGILNFQYEILYNILWVAFAVEFGAKLFLANDLWIFLRANYYAPLIIVFPFLRPFGLFPLSRFGLLVFIDQVYDHFNGLRKYRVLETLLIIIVVVILFSDLFLLVETEPGTTFKSFGDSVWFVIVTIATVGYGDIYPKTALGRTLAVALIIFGISTFSVVVAKISSFFMEKDTFSEIRAEKKELKQVLYEEKSIEEFEKKLEDNDVEIKKRLVSIEKKL